MTNKHEPRRRCLLAVMLLFSLCGCDKSTDTQNQLLDMSQITVTGAQGPDDFIGNIDTSDWDRSSYGAMFFGKSFWVQKASASDTLFFVGRSAGDTVSRALKIYNGGNAILSIGLQLQSPFLVGNDAVHLQPSSLGMISISFILPDTTDTVYNGRLTLRCSTQDSLVLSLQGYRVPAGSGGVVSENAPELFRLVPAYPNPTDGEIRFVFTVPQSMDALLQVLNNKNEIVATIAQGNYIAGAHSVSWNADLTNGNYRVVFQAGTYRAKGDIRVWR